MICERQQIALAALTPNRATGCVRSAAPLIQRVVRYPIEQHRARQQSLQPTMLALERSNMVSLCHADPRAKSLQPKIKLAHL
jgi:hypothetical protein